MFIVTETEFWILTGLAGGRSHGWALLTDVGDLSEGSMRLKMATLYLALDKLRVRGLIEVEGEEMVEGRTRRYYRLTGPGAQALGLAAQQRAASARVASARLAGAALSRPALANG